jgi:hypothetical protein
VPTSHAPQKKALDHRKKRAAAAKEAREKARIALRPDRRDILRLAAGRPFGPAYVSHDWDVADGGIPRLVTVVVTRRGPAQALFGALVLLDRTCLGVKNALLLPPQTDLDLSWRMEDLGYAIGEMRRIDPAQAQSVVYRAIDHARSLGFEPHPDFPEAIFGPRPPELVETPLEWHGRPIYISGPHDDVPRIISRLAAAVGPAGFDCIAAAPGLGDIDDEEILEAGGEPNEDDDEDDDDESDAAGVEPPRAPMSSGRA